MNLTVMQEGIEYYYKCEECCDNCPLRFICYTTKTYRYNDRSVHMTFMGFPLLDYLVVKAMINGTLCRIGSDSSTWSGLS